MKNFLLPFLLCRSFFYIYDCRAQTVEKASDLVGVFDGRTPCQELAKQFNQTTTPECIKIKWRLKLYKGPAKNDEGTFQLEGFVFKGADVLKGKWHTTIGTAANPEALVYQLDPVGRSAVFFLKANDNVFFFLDPQKNLMVGNRDFSYTLNRTATN